MMQRPMWMRTIIFVAIVAAGAGARLWFRDLPNFAPVAALALFAGYLFRSAFVAVSVPILVMSLSDLVIGGYDARMMTLVYGSLTLPVAWRGWLRRWFRLDASHWGQTAAASAGLMTASLASSLLFFFITNFGSWLWSDMYQPTLGGLLHCYTQALPFFRNTLTGDMLFAAALFGGYAVALRLRSVAQQSVVLSSE